MFTIDNKTGGYSVIVPATILDNKAENAASFSGDLVELAADPRIALIAGRYAIGGEPNQNLQLMSVDDMAEAAASLVDMPLNVNHLRNVIVGHYKTSQVMYPKDEGDAPYIEAIAAYYKEYMPDGLWSKIEESSASGSLFFSMEALPSHIQFSRENESGQLETSEKFTYRGPSHSSYMGWDQAGATRSLHSPIFIGGALIIPPVKPGWANAVIEKITHTERRKVATLASQIGTELAYLSEDDCVNLAVEFSGFSAEAESLEVDESFIPNSSLPKQENESLQTDNRASLLRGESDSSNTDETSEGGDSMSTFTQEQVDATVTEAIVLKDQEIQALQTQIDDSTVSNEVAAATEPLNAEIADLMSKLDEKVIELEAAKLQYSDLVEYLEAEVAAATAAEELAALKAARIDAVQNVASFPADHVESSSDRWAAMADENFNAMLADYAAVAEKASTPSAEDKGDKSIVPETSALSHESSTGGTQTSSLAAFRGVDFTTL